MKNVFTAKTMFQVTKYEKSTVNPILSNVWTKLQLSKDFGQKHTTFKVKKNVNRPY